MGGIDLFVLKLLTINRLIEKSWSLSALKWPLTGLIWRRFAVFDAILWPIRAVGLKLERMRFSIPKDIVRREGEINCKGGGDLGTRTACVAPVSRG